MLSFRISDCSDCASIISLLEDIDCKIKELAIEMYNNVIFALNNPIKYGLFIDLIVYRRILTYRYTNSEYAQPYTDEQIASRVKLLKFK